MSYNKRKILLERFEKFTSDSYFTKVNLLSRVYPQQQDIDLNDIYYYSVPNLERAPPKKIIEHAKQLFTKKLSERSEGLSFGPSWSTHWFQLNLQIPESYRGSEVHLLWDSENELLIFDVDGVPLQGLTGGDYQKRHQYIVRKADSTVSSVVLYLEMACNGMFGVGKDGMINAPDPNRTFTIKKRKIATLDKEAYDLLMDFKIVSEMAKHLPEDSNRGNQALQCASDIIDHCDTMDRSTWPRAQKMAKDFLKETNGSSQHTVICVGNCHIDVAWLWPYDETRRKCGRSWSSQCEYMDSNPNYIFAQSQAQLFDWVKSDYPELFQKIKMYVNKGQFLPVGGTWVEMDGILPSGESMVRQFLKGQRFFKQEFGSYATEFWLPDSFGYSGQLPQIMMGANISAFVTQKLSWNMINKFPNTTFMWEGLDGSRVVSHFPPADNYCAHCDVEQLLFMVKNAQGKDKMNFSLSLYGHGDGGGGPTPEMLDRIKICENVDGLPKLKFGTPKEFFEICKEVDGTRGLNTWRGELYLEMHRGTYTSQASTKKGNRKGEMLLRDVEIFSIIAGLHEQSKYPEDELDKMWKLLLLNQFHDVLPGSSIKLAYDDALRYYNQIQESGAKLRDEALSKVLQSATSDSVTVFNSVSWDRREVVELPKGVQGAQKTEAGTYLALVEAPSIGYQSQSVETTNVDGLDIREDDECITMENKYISVAVHKEKGTLIVFDKRAKRVAVRDANQFTMFDDIPLFWDAWDVEFYHVNKPAKVGLPSTVSIKENGPLRVSIEVVTPITTTSTITQQIQLTAVSPRIDFVTHAKWHEAHKFLKAQFPTTVRANSTTYEVQFGHLTRPNHRNTSWDWAQFEVHGHKWADISEYNYGISLLNDCKYGYSCLDNVINLSLLRAPKSPDDECDMGDHYFTYSLLPHLGTFQASGVIQEAYNLNIPLIVKPKAMEAAKTHSFVSISTPQVIIESIKKAEDTDDIVVRLYEAHGGSVSDVLLTFAKQIKSVKLCNLLEEPLVNSSNATSHNKNEVTIPHMKPFEIVSLLIEL